MKEGKCPKCGSSEIYVNTNMQRAHASHLATGWFAAAVLDHYACVTCGYVETYVESQEDRTEITEKWKRVGI